MKVTTDSCLFGAWAASIMKAGDQHADSPKTLLDIGTGTGLLTLMCLQARPGLQATAVEIDEQAAAQATENFNNSPSANSVMLVCDDIHLLQWEKPFDYIICNPPFHEQHLKGDNAAKNLAHHDEGLLLTDLLRLAGAAAHPHTFFFLMLPFYRSQQLINLAKESTWQVACQVQVRQSEKHDYFRTLFCLVRQPGTHSSSTSICIRENGLYSASFTTLLQPYYIQL
jgi:tRNA1Val (adenine37-N6)-methyltransferase